MNHLFTSFVQSPLAWAFPPPPFPASPSLPLLEQFIALLQSALILPLPPISRYPLPTMKGCPTQAKEDKIPKNSNKPSPPKSINPHTQPLALPKKYFPFFFNSAYLRNQQLQIVPPSTNMLNIYSAPESPQIFYISGQVVNINKKG